LAQTKKGESKMKTFQIAKTGGYTNGRFLSGISEVREDGTHPTGFDFDRTESSNFAQRDEKEIMRQINTGEKTFTDFPRKIIKWAK